MVAILTVVVVVYVLTRPAAAVLVFHDYGAGFTVVAVLPGEGMVARTGRAWITTNI